MNDDMNQQQFISRLKAALADQSGTMPEASAGTSETGGMEADELLNPSPHEKQRRMDLLLREAADISLHVSVVKSPEEASDAVAGLVQDRDPEWGSTKQVALWEHPLLERMRLSDVFAGMGIPVHIARMTRAGERKKIRDKIIASFVGVTSADFCIAESATLVMKNRPGQPRSVSLLPSIHIAVIREDQVIPDLKSLYWLMLNESGHVKEGLGNAITMVTGPSKTADIEATLVHGAHGPKEVHLIVIAAD